MDPAEFSKAPAIDPADVPDSLPNRDWLYSFDGMAAYALPRLLKSRGIEPRGVIQLGANIGEQIATFLMMGYERCLLVEPAPGVLDVLRQNVSAANALVSTLDRFSDMPEAERLRIAPVAAGAEDGQATLHILEASHHTSLHAPLPDAGLGPVTKTVDVPVKSVDTLLQELEPPWQPEHFNALFMNIQGHELEALRGAEETLQQLDLVYLELNFEDRYESCPSPTELDEFLRERGFHPVLRFVEPLQDPPEFGYALYCR